MLKSLGRGLAVTAMMTGVSLATNAISAGLIVAAVATGAVAAYTDYHRRARKNGA